VVGRLASRDVGTAAEHLMISRTKYLFSFAFALLSATALAGSEAGVLDLYDEVVCRVNTEAVSKRQVEERMGMIALKLDEYRRQLEANGQWNEENRKKWDDLYIPPFRDALRVTIKERLMLQHAKEAKTPIDEVAFNKQVRETADQLRKEGVMNSKGFSLGEVQKRIREQTLMRTFRSMQIVNFLDNPNRPEVKRYYEENIQRYQRKAGSKVRLIRVDRFVVNKLTGKNGVRENAYEEAERLREDIVTYKADFAEVAKRHSDDEESKSRGGLLMLDPKDPYIDPESYNAQLAKALRGVKKGDVSKVFELGQTSWAFAYIEDTRDAGPAPLEGELYDEIFRTLQQLKTKKKEDEWMRKALSRSLVVHVVHGNPTQLPMEFFFPEDREVQAPDPKADPKAENKASEAKPAKNEAAATK
jgi:foldase protein PrsA